VLFDIPAPTLSMSRVDWLRKDDPNRLDRFTSPNDPGVDGFDPGYYHRFHGWERFECEDWERGFEWNLEVNDLRPYLDGRITSVSRSLWRREVQGLGVVLRDSGVWLTANPAVVEPDDDGRTIPEKGEWVSVVLNDEGEVDRIWLRRLVRKRQRQA
jgi:hypothetical protein